MSTAWTTFRCLGCGQRFPVAVLLPLTGGLGYDTVCSWPCLEEARVERLSAVQQVTGTEVALVRQMVREEIAAMRQGNPCVTPPGDCPVPGAAPGPAPRPGDRGGRTRPVA